MYGFSKTPVLSKGAHTSPEEGMCIMELVSFINREPFCDSPRCTDDRISTYMQNVNDSVTEEERPKLLSVIDRLFHTGDMTRDQRVETNIGLQGIWPELGELLETAGTKFYYQQDMADGKQIPSCYAIWNFLYHLSMSTESVDVKLAVLNKVLDVMDEAMGVGETLPQSREEIEKMLGVVR